MSSRRWGWKVASALVLAPAAAHSMCGAPFEQNAFKRPIDYTNPADREFVTIWVEPFHFTREVEALVRGKSSDIVGDLSYTLRQIPNHHRALNSMMRWQLEHKLPADAPERLIYPMECYFERALAMGTNDPAIYVLQGIFFHRSKQYQDSLRSYDRALAINPNLAELHYNLGLLLIDMKDYAKAREHAERAYELGYPMPGLRNKLQRLGYWTAKPAAATTPTAGTAPPEETAPSAPVAR
jgi:tetratricopeptide (TPR) repeat protein